MPLGSQEDQIWEHLCTATPVAGAEAGTASTFSDHSDPGWSTGSSSTSQSSRGGLGEPHVLTTTPGRGPAPMILFLSIRPEHAGGIQTAPAGHPDSARGAKLRRSGRSSRSREFRSARVITRPECHSPLAIQQRKGNTSLKRYPCTVAEVIFISRPPQSHISFHSQQLAHVN